jgi:glycosyltransferase involved in cell wall biosynthesis
MRISVITVSYNASKRLERTIKSVEGQDCRGFEYIVVDGNSRDDSRSVIEAHAGIIDRSIIECDTGPFQAMNKGAAAASGDYLLFLNSGDEFARATSLSEAAGRLAGKDLYYADAVFSRGGREWTQEFPDAIDLNYLIGHALNHQNLFVRREYLLGRGGYREKYGIISDWAFMVEAFWTETPSIERLPFVVSRYYLDGISGARDNRAKVLSEKMEFLRSLDPKLGIPVYRYIEQCDSEYYRVGSRFRDKGLFERLMIVPLAVMKVLARMGF